MTTSAQTAKGERANRVAERIKKIFDKMTPAERRRKIAEIRRDLAEHAPTLESAGSDLLMLLNAVGAEFVARYYPDATTASFSVVKYSDEPRFRSGMEYHVLIATAVPEVPRG